MARLPFPTKQELLEVIERKKQLLEKPDLSLEPPWVQDSNDPVRKELREVTRREATLKTRLGKNLQEFRDQVDLNF